MASFTLWLLLWVLVLDASAWMTPPAATLRRVHRFTRDSCPGQRQADGWNRCPHSLPVSSSNNGNQLLPAMVPLKNSASDDNEHEAEKDEHDTQQPPQKNNDKNNDKSKGRSIGPLGGRRTKIRSPPTKKSDDNKTLTWWSIPALLLSVLLVQGILSGGGNDSNFVYYTSSVYESRVYNSDGKVETSRKESFQSNLPSLVEQQRQQSSRPGEFLSDRRLPVVAPEDEMLQEMDKMMRAQDVLMDSFFR